MNGTINFDESQHKLFSGALELLKQLISIPSFSKEEDKTADAINNFLIQRNITNQSFS